jgi:hypothetical protein
VESVLGWDVHQATISVAASDCTGKVVMECILETKAATILEFFAGLRGTLSVTLEEGTWATWLYDLLNPQVDELVVCNPRKNALLKDGNKSDHRCAQAGADPLEPPPTPQLSLTCPFNPPTIPRFRDWPNHIALPHHREAGWRRHGCGIQGRGR